MLHLKDLYCTKIVQIVVGGRWAQARTGLAAIVPRSYCTRGMGARQGKSAPKPAEQSPKRTEKRGDGQFGGERLKPTAFNRRLQHPAGYDAVTLRIGVRIFLKPFVEEFLQ